MTIIIGRRAVGLLIAAGSLLLAGAPLAQQYPDKPVKIIVPYPPGNASDAVSRIVSEHLTKRLGQPIVIENRPGATGGIGAQAVARSAPDGYTLLMTSTSFTINTALTAKLMYDIEKDFAPVALATTGGGMLLLVRPDFPANNVQQLVDLLKKNPDKYNYAHVGRGTIQHLTMESFLAGAGATATGIAYKGSVAGLTDIVGGEVQMMFDAQGSSLPLVQAGKLKVLAISSKDRATGYPNVPTAAESGLPGLKNWEVNGWVALLAPARTPKPVLDRLNKEVTEILRLPEVQQKLAGQRMEPLPAYSADRTREWLMNDMKRWQAAASAAKLEKE